MSDAGICHSGTWSAPRLVVETATSSEERGASISSDELTLYFLSNRNGGQMRAIWQTTRAARADPFGSPTLVSEVDSPTDDTDPEISADNLTLYFTSMRSGTDDLYWATRATTSDPFVDQGALQITGDPSTIRYAPSLSPDELTLYYIGDLDIQVATRAAKTDTFAWVRELTELNASQTESGPTITADGLEIFFESFRSGPGVIYTASRPSTSDVFSAPVALPELAAPGGTSSGSPSITSDGRTLYYYVTIGQVDIYTATRDCP